MARAQASNRASAPLLPSVAERAIALARCHARSFHDVSEVSFVVAVDSSSREGEEAEVWRRVASRPVASSLTAEGGRRGTRSRKLKHKLSFSSAILINGLRITSQRKVFNLLNIDSKLRLHDLHHI